MQKKILIVEDSVISRELIIRSIPEKMYQIREAADGQKAWYEVQRFEPDLIILDLNMPNVNGWAFLTELRASDYKALVAVCTTEILQEDELRKNGVVAYIKKPIVSVKIQKLLSKIFD